MTNIINDFKEIMDKYPTAMKEPQKNHSLAKKMRNDFTNNLTNIINEIVDKKDKYKVKISPGMMGRWANPPWAGVCQIDCTNTFTEGLYIIYHFRPDENIIDLSINQGLTSISRKEARSRAIKLREYIKEIPDGFSLDEYDLTTSAVLYKTYNIDELDVDEFKEDLKNLIEIYEYLIPLYNKLYQVNKELNEFTWIDFYTEFADKLLEYKDNRPELVDKVVNLWNHIDMKMPKLELDNEIEDIDPFTIFGLFNKSLTQDNRIKILKYFKDEFKINGNVPKDFMGVPTLNPQKATFYFFKDKRGYDDIDNLWNLFESALDYVNTGNSSDFIHYYDKVLNQLGIRWNITMALYWIRPYNYINLDNTNRTFLSDNNTFSDDISIISKNMRKPPKASDYLDLTDKCLNYLNNENIDFHSLPELSIKADMYSKNHNVDESDTGIGDSDNINEVNYWLYAPGQGANKWEKYYKNGIMGIGWKVIGNLTNFSSQEEITKKLQEINHNKAKYTNDSLALWQFANEIKPGDIVYAKKGMHEIIGYGIVKSGYSFNKNYDDEHFHILHVNWKEKGNWKYDGTLAMKTLTRLTDYPEDINIINSYFEQSPEDEEQITEYPLYTEDDFLEEAYITEDDYNTLCNLLKYKKNLIIQGAPGVGKTFISKRLAYSLIGFKDKTKVSLVQFHQSYSYEDFIMGYRPSEDGFKLTHGVFYNFCKKAEEDKENNYFFIIDEINRGNLSKIFGELFMLIENDKRGPKNKIQLVYTKETFNIPENVYIIGMMNTADRSLALVDYALRRRFVFYRLEPAFDSVSFNEYLDKLDSIQLNSTIEMIKELNVEILNDESLGPGFMIGHSYFTNISSENIEEQLNIIIEYELIPLLEEYWFDEEDKLDHWKNKLRSVIV